MVQLTSSSYRMQKKSGEALETEFDMSVYKNHPTITLQQMPRRPLMGQLSQSTPSPEAGQHPQRSGE